jgi:ubiquitin-protein ligase E3 C
LRKKVAISFVDEFGLLEAGVDGGGVFKEFLTT